MRIGGKKLTRILDILQGKKILKAIYGGMFFSVYLLHGPSRYTLSSTQRACGAICQVNKNVKSLETLWCGLKS